MDPFVAEIRIFPFNFAPKGWAFCDGQILPLSQNTEHCSRCLERPTVAMAGAILPCRTCKATLRCIPCQGPGLSLHDLGETGSGSETVSRSWRARSQHTRMRSVENNTLGDTPTPSPAVTLSGRYANAYQQTTNTNLRHDE